MIDQTNEQFDLINIEKQLNARQILNMIRYETNSNENQVGINSTVADEENNPTHYTQTVILRMVQALVIVISDLNPACLTLGNLVGLNSRPSFSKF